VHCKDLGEEGIHARLKM